MKKIFFIFIFIINFIKIYVSSVFKTITLINGDYLIINKNGIYTYNKESLKLLKSYDFENSLKLEDNEIENISYIMISEYNSIFILTKNYLYIFSIEGIYKNNYKFFEYKEINYYSINLYECLDSSECYYFVEFINKSKNLVIELYKYNFIINSNDLISSKDFSLKIENYFNCHLMTKSDNDNYLTCFFESENHNNVISSTFNVDNSYNVENLNSINYKINGTKIIKSIISYDKVKALICFIDNLGNLNFMIYNINTFQFNDFINIFNNCLYTSSNLFNIEQFPDFNNYFLYCFYSLTEFSLIQLDQNFQIYSNITDYKIDEHSLNECTQFYLSKLFYSSNFFNVLTNCNKGSFSPIKLKAEKEYVDIINMETNIPKDSIEIKMSKVLSYLDINKSYEIKGTGYIISISLIEENKEGNYIDFLSCEEKLRNISKNKLILFLIEINIDDKKWVNNKIKYYIFNENKKQLDLSVCKDENILIHYRIKNESQFNLTKISYFDELGVNIFNREDPFFTDICFSYSENGADMILKDRLTYIYQNYTICDSSCLYQKTEVEQKKFLCNCTILSLFESKLNNLDSIDSKEKKLMPLSNGNFGVIKCYKLVFNFKNKLKNIGF